MGRRYKPAIVWPAVALAGGMPPVYADTPRSGYVHTVSYTVDGKGNRVGEPAHDHVWFSARKTLHKSAPGSAGVSVETVGQGSWTSLPAIGRILEAPATTFGPTTYP